MMLCLTGHNTSAGMASNPQLYNCNCMNYSSANYLLSNVVDDGTSIGFSKRLFEIWLGGGKGGLERGWRGVGEWLGRRWEGFGKRLGKGRGGVGEGMERALEFCFKTTRLKDPVNGSLDFGPLCLMLLSLFFFAKLFFAEPLCGRVRDELLLSRNDCTLICKYGWTCHEHGLVWFRVRFRYPPG